jgi:hypothetical protein
LPDTAIGDKSAVRAETTRDLLIVFTDLVKVKFNTLDVSLQTHRGRWCKICKSVCLYSPEKLMILTDIATEQIPRS